MLQNADDAGATEIHFVKDPRQHATERVFDESWKPLQGPALCVYNDSPFSETDLAGIQRLGEGSKAFDPNKTGQYGVGFNCVYHLTDAPSFLTCGPKIGESLCVFDPHASYVPGASIEEPGRRYDDVPELKEIFTDIFPPYLGNYFDLSNATMFRFPLRTPNMAMESELSDKSVSVEELDTLLGKFKSEIYDCLLFVNNVNRISISEITKGSQRMQNTYSVSVEMSNNDQVARQQFADNVRQVSKQITAGDIYFWEIPPREVTYTLRLKDNKGYWEKWLVTQRIGYDEGARIPPSLYEAFKSGDLALLPRGGVAALLESSDTEFSSRAKKAYCFLPLPVKTGLPVHINAHFALNHEARRALWFDDEAGPKTDWNYMLMREVVAKAYVAMLRSIPSYLTTAQLDGNTCFFAVEGDTVPDILFYSNLFPIFNGADPYIKTLIKSFYKTVDACAEPILPVIKAKQPTTDSCSDDSLGECDLDLPNQWCCGHKI